MNQEEKNKQKRINKEVLLIEDDQILIEKARHKLERKGFNVWTTYSIEEALYYLDVGLESDNKIIIFLLKRE